ncbi:NAD(P)-dependent oxidoreductase [Candidatus Entotheonella palauensis]|uniref:NAD(P)-dependent oxidoreductase n=1 Tax=Candidatus Entotheonella palauensis TaxID=93172 RepID=UPI000B7D95F1|nr:NAD(P)-binding domain-containing protein [Candidatus Entotheonella palauensis]
MTTTHQGQRLAFIGLGAMGGPMASRLAASGYTVTGYDIQAAAMERLRQAGGKTASNAAEAAADADLLITIVASAEQVEEVLFGDTGALTTLTADSTIMVCSTVPPDYMQTLGQRLQTRGYELLDAPVSGGVAGAANGTLTVMASGSAAAFEACEPLLPILTAKQYRLGDVPGHGSICKVINQLLVGVHHAVTVEAMALAARVGADLEAVYEVIANSSGASQVFVNRVPDLLSEDVTPSGVLDIFVKDLGIVLGVGQEAHFPLPMAASAHQMFLMGSAAGLGQERPIDLIKIYEKLAGLHIQQSQ